MLPTAPPRSIKRPPLLYGPVPNADFQRCRQTWAPNFVFPDADGTEIACDRRPNRQGSASAPQADKIWKEGRKLQKERGSRPSSAARCPLLSSGIAARPGLPKLVYQVPIGDTPATGGPTGRLSTNRHLRATMKHKRKESSVVKGAVPAPRAGRELPLSVTRNLWNRAVLPEKVLSKN